MSSSDLVLVVDEGTAPLAGAVTKALMSRQVRSERITSWHLASIPVRVTTREASVKGCRLRGVVFLARPDGAFSNDFVEADQSFCNNETRAVWLAILGLPTVATVNRPDAELWYSSSEWSVWRRRFEHAGVPVADVVIGDSEPSAEWSWLPWGGGFLSAPGPRAARCFAPAVTNSQPAKKTLWCCGAMFGDSVDERLGAATSLLEQENINLAALTSDQDGRVLRCTAYPQVSESVAPRVAALIAEDVVANMHRR